MENGKQGVFACEFGHFSQKGLTKREYFAGLAMQAVLSIDLNTYRSDEQAAARVAVGYADALLNELEKDGNI